MVQTPLAQSATLIFELLRSTSNVSVPFLFMSEKSSRSSSPAGQQQRKPSIQCFHEEVRAMYWLHRSVLFVLLIFCGVNFTLFLIHHCETHDMAGSTSDDLAQPISDQ